MTRILAAQLLHDSPQLRERERVVASDQGVRIDRYLGIDAQPSKQSLPKIHQKQQQPPQCWRRRERID